MNVYIIIYSLKGGQKMPKKQMLNCCQMHKGKGFLLLVLGLVILINAYMPFLNWGAFIGLVLILAGFLKLVMPHEHHK
jgi:uncharacterized membrane protein HdeD (DUF308 family)